MFPQSRLTDITATGDICTGPGIPTVLVEAMPAAVMGDMIDGAVCVGAITEGSPTVLVMGIPAARVTSMVTGANPETGVPVSTVMATGAFTVLIP